MNYSKWDKIQFSDSDEEDEDEESKALNVEITKKMQELMDKEKKEKEEKKNKKPTTQSSYVKIDPNDDLGAIHPIFLTNPDEFFPRKSIQTGEYETFGLSFILELYSDEDFSRFNKRMMSSQFLYFSSKWPEEQFIERLIEKKRKKLKEGRPEAEKLFKRDYVLKIYLRDIEPQIWRRFVVSGGIKLSILQDKIISPIMGWERNYHGYIFTDRKDGMLFGPEKSNAIDLMHIKNLNIWTYYPDDQVYLGELLQKVGDKLGYIYDLGDQWSHEIEVEEIKSVEESVGQAICLDGKMQCPPEDSCGLDGMGNKAYQDKMKILTNPKHPKYSKTVNEMKASLNFKNKIFNITRFDINEANSRLKEALHTKGSDRSGAKQFMFPFDPSSVDSIEQLGKGVEVQKAHTFDCGHSSYLVESVKSNERKRETICQTCGNPNNLRKCSGCLSVYYCGSSCQKRDWSQHKIFCKVQQAKTKS